MLAEAYCAYKETSADVEVIFISSDRDNAAFKEYFQEMPWIALPFDARAQKTSISEKYQVRGIPTLIVLDGATGATISSNGRADVMSANGNLAACVSAWGKA